MQTTYPIIQSCLTSGSFSYTVKLNSVQKGEKYEI